MDSRPLGGSGIEVSVLSLGSWRTFERIPREQAVAVMVAARDAGITFLDDARYNDETGTAPLASGYSEVLFGELYRAAGWRRDETIVANKLWWEFWPEQSAMQELDGSLERTGFDHVDLEYATTLPPGLDVTEAVRQVGALIESGKARAWGVANWSPADIVEAVSAARSLGVPPPCAAQLQHSLVNRAVVEDAQMQAALAGAGSSVVASASLAYGALSGKYAAPGAGGRIADQIDDPEQAEALAAGAALVDLGARLDAAPATLALAFALSHESVASVLFGATGERQVAENVAAAELLGRIDDDDLAELSRIGAGAAR